MKVIIIFTFHRTLGILEIVTKRKWRSHRYRQPVLFDSFWPEHASRRFIQYIREISSRVYKKPRDLPIGLHADIGMSKREISI